MNADSLLTNDFKATPYWWDRSPLSEATTASVPGKADVLVIGAGYTGLCAALELARAGRNTVVVDAEQIGFGCSTRNGGQISSSIKPGYRALSKQYGADLAAQILGDGHEALRWIGEFVARENIDCDFRRCGRFYAAHNAVAYESLSAKLDDQAPGVKINADQIPRAEQHKYIGSEHYHGGMLYHDHCSLDPGAYHAGLLRRVREAGATVLGGTRAEQLKRHKTGFRVTLKETGKGKAGSGHSGAKTEIQAREVIVATNGYSGNLVPWLRKRIIPIGSYIIATEPLDADTMQRLIPDGRVITDTKRLVVYYRPSPDNTRILFGARVAISESDPVRAIPALHQELAIRFPELGTTRVSHAWMGYVAYTFDAMPHLGKQEGVHYAMGYCGSGVSLSSFSGTRVARQVLGKEDPAAFSKTEFKGRFYYRNKPWFLAPSIAWYKFLDSRGV